MRAEAAGNIAVLHTPPGAAQFFAGHLDRSTAFDTVGTVAGDDTVIIVMRTARGRRPLREPAEDGRPEESTMTHEAAHDEALGRAVRRWPVGRHGGTEPLHPLRLATGAVRRQQTRAHATVLHGAGLLTDDELARVVAALDSLAGDIATGAFPDPGRRGRAHRGRARPHRAARRPRRQAPRRAQPQRPGLHGLPAVLRDHAGASSPPSRPPGRPAHTGRGARRTYPPGFTHLQHAQPITFGHELAKHAQGLGRDVDRLRDWDRRAARSPLWAGALAGSSLRLDPQAVADELGFDEALGNSIDATATATGSPNSCSPPR